VRFAAHLGCCDRVGELALLEVEQRRVAPHPHLHAYVTREACEAQAAVEVPSGAGGLQPVEGCPQGSAGESGGEEVQAPPDAFDDLADGHEVQGVLGVGDCSCLQVHG
jgi:hypothetical protein